MVSESLWADEGEGNAGEHRLRALFLVEAKLGVLRERKKVFELCKLQIKPLNN